MGSLIRNFAIQQDAPSTLAKQRVITNFPLGPVKGSSFVTPTGTGFAHITNGVLDPTAQPVPSADIPQGNGFYRLVDGVMQPFADSVHEADLSLYDNDVRNANKASHGFLAKLSGNSSDYVGGDNQCHALPSVTVESIGALPISGARVWHVGSGAGMYPTIQAALDAINVAPVPPSINARCQILIWPGTYTMTNVLGIPGFVAVTGTHKGAARLINATSDMFQSAGDSVWFENFLIEGSNCNFAAFNLNGKSHQHIRNVDMLANGGANTQVFLNQSGSTWKTLFVERCVIDSYKASNYLFFLANTSDAARAVDVEINDVFSDTYHLTNFGGSFLLRQASDVRFRNSKIRGGNSAGGNSYQTGIRHESNGATGTCSIEIFTSFLSGAVGFWGSTGTSCLLMNSDAVGSSSNGTLTIRNSSVT